MEQTPDRGPVFHRAACFQTTPVAAARAGRSSRDRAPAKDVPDLLDRFQQDFGSILPEKGKNGLKFDHRVILGSYQILSPEWVCGKLVVFGAH